MACGCSKKSKEQAAQVEAQRQADTVARAEKQAAAATK